MIVREARIDQKVARREAAREASPEMLRLPGGGDVMGGDDSLAAARARWGSFFCMRYTWALVEHSLAAKSSCAAT